MDKGRLNGFGRFTDHVALVVGGAQGIGKAIAVRLAREGAHVVIADVDRSKMDEAVDEMRRECLSVRSLCCDVRRSDQVGEMVSTTAQWRSRIDILMYIAGIAPSV